MQTLMVPVLTSLSMLVVLLLVCPSGTTGVNNTAEDFLDDKEELVRTIGYFALQNYRNSSVLAEKCVTSSSTCSRRVCAPLRSDLDLTCLTAPRIRNADCQGSNNSTCGTFLVSKKQAYLRWAPDANLGYGELPTCEMRNTICSLRELDGQILIKGGSNSDFALQGFIYFAASNGLSRVYPGRELNFSSCNKFEVRERPWFKGATAVQKELVIMLDAGPSMGRYLSLLTGSRQSVFDASINITLRLLNTLSKDDRISVFTCTSSQSAPTLVLPKIAVTDSPSTLDPLTTAIRRLVPDLNPSGNQQANLTAALIGARDQFSNQSNQQLKVVIIITAGEMVGPEDLQSDLVESLASSNMTVFTYRLLGTNITAQKTGNDDVTTKLKNASCSLNGSYEEGLYEPRNPLGTLQSFYSYVARLRFDIDHQRPYWVPKYTAFSGISDITTLAYPGFHTKTFTSPKAHDTRNSIDDPKGTRRPKHFIKTFSSQTLWKQARKHGDREYIAPEADGEIMSQYALIHLQYELDWHAVFDNNFLVGVAGIDLLLDNFGDISSNVYALLANRNRIQSLPISDPPKINCSQTLWPGGDSSCPAALQANANVTGFCTDTDNNPNKDQLFKSRACCKSCRPGEYHGLSKAGKTGVIIGATLVGTLSVAGILGWCIYANICSKAGPNPEKDDQGPLTNLQSPTPSRDDNYYNDPL